MPAHVSPIERVRSLAHHPRLVPAAFLLALALSLPSLSQVMALDDFVLGIHARGDHGIAGLRLGPFGDLFTFTSGRPEDNLAMMADGTLLPWWTDPQHLNSFLRPLSSLTHRLDFFLFPSSPLLMHLHSWLWFAALLAVALSFFRQTAGRAAATAAVGFSFFALDESHAATLSWIANRNAIVALTFGMAAVVQHHRLAVSGRFRHAVFGPVLFVTGLLGGEAAIGALGYLLAHALVCERDPWWKRALRLLPYGLSLVAWRVLYRHYGLGSFGSGGYHDPIREPLSFVAALARNLPILLGSQVTVPYADQAFWGPPQGLLLLVALSLGVIAGTWAISRSLLARSPLARYYALSSVMAAIPVSASVPGQRLLLGLSFGAAGFLSLVVLDLVQRERRSVTASAVALAVATMHGPIAALSLPPTARSMTTVGEVAERMEESLPSGEAVMDQTCVLVTSPLTIFASYIQPMRVFKGTPRPAHLYWLATQSSAVSVRRDDRNSLVVSLERGFIENAQDRHYRRDPTALSPGTQVALPRMTATVLTSTADGRPAQVRFVFDAALEDPSLCFVEYRAGRYVPWAIPGVSESRTFEQQDLFLTLAQHVLGGE